MSKRRHDHHPSSHPAKLGGTNRRPMAVVGLLLGLVVCVAVLVWTPSPNRGSNPAPAPPSAVPTNPPTSAAALPTPTTSATAKLVGKWLRPDGGYELEIKGIGSDGKVEATYANPKPIHVARAESSADGTSVRLFVELRDTGYPGCTYKLEYKPEQDQLEGIYFQAALQEEFEVVFVRTQ